MGEGLLQRLIMELLRPMLAQALAMAGRSDCVGADQFIYFRQGDPFKRIAPDVYVLPAVQPRHISTWKVWEEGIVPSFCFEVVSTDVRYDYEEKPVLYKELGPEELVIFDPASDGKPGRFRWQVYRNVKRRGLVRVDVSHADRIRSKSLGLWLRHVGDGVDLRVVPAFGPHGDDPMPTPDQRADEERAQKELERAEKERALAEVAKLREELARPQRPVKPKLSSRTRQR